MTGESGYFDCAEMCTICHHILAPRGDPIWDEQTLYDFIYDLLRLYIGRYEHLELSRTPGARPAPQAKVFLCVFKTGENKHIIIRPYYSGGAHPLL